MPKLRSKNTVGSEHKTTNKQSYISKRISNLASGNGAATAAGSSDPLSLNTNNDVDFLNQDLQNEKTSEEINIERILSNADFSDREELAKHLLRQSNINLPVTIESMRFNGFCLFEGLSDSSPSQINVTKYALKKNDPRAHIYQIKTAFHEFYHALSNGLTCDRHLFRNFNEWAVYDDIGAECTSHYLLSRAGFNSDILPSYSEHLIMNLPKMKTMREFKECSTIVDFGKVLSRYRFSDAEKSAQWKSINDQCKSINFNMKEYAQQYETYVRDNIDDIVDKIYEGVALPPADQYKQTIKQGILSSWSNYDASSQAFTDSLIIAMNREEIKPCY